MSEKPAPKPHPPIGSAPSWLQPILPSSSKSK